MSVTSAILLSGELVKISEPLYRVLSRREENVSLIAETLFENGDLAEDEFIEIQSSPIVRAEKWISLFAKMDRTTASYERLTTELNKHDTENTWVLLNYAGELNMSFFIVYCLSNWELKTTISKAP